MLVFLQAAPNPAHSHLQHPPDTTMAPPQQITPSTLIFDGPTQIISNCRFLISKGDTIEVVTSKDPTDKLFKALAFQCSEESREILLESAHCENAQKALESLHTKSCEAIHEYTVVNRLAKPCNLKLACLEPNFLDDDAASIISGGSESSTAAISDWGSSCDEVMMLKHRSRTSEISKDRQHPCGRPNHCITSTGGDHELVGDTRSRKNGRDDALESGPPRGRAVRPARSRSPSFGFRQGPPPPPPGHPGTSGPSAPPPLMRNVPLPLASHPYTAGIGAGPHPGRPQNMNPYLPPMQHFPSLRGPGFPVDGPPLPTPPAPTRPGKPTGHVGNGSNYNNHLPRPLSVFHPQARTHTVLIVVHWLRHGQHRIIAQCQPTRESLQSAAVTDVRMNPDAFTSDNKNPTSSNTSSKYRDSATTDNRDSSAMTLRAHVRQAVLAGEPYDMRTFHGQDLVRLFHVMAADDNMPSFEVIVEELPRDVVDDSSSDDDGASDRGPVRNGRWD